MPEGLSVVWLFCPIFTRAALLDCDGLLLRQLRRFLFRDAQSQEPVLHLRLDVLFGDVLADVEGSLHSAGVSLLTNQLTVLVVLILVDALCRADGQIAVFKVDRNVFLLEDVPSNTRVVIGKPALVFSKK